MTKAKAKAVDWRDVLDDALADPEVRAEWDRTELARMVALRLVRYRADNDLSQTALARELGMLQPAVSRLETGDVNPSLETLARISAALKIEFLIDIAPSSRRKLVTVTQVQGATTVQRATAGGHSILFAAT